MTGIQSIHNIRGGGFFVAELLEHVDIILKDSLELFLELNLRSGILK